MRATLSESIEITARALFNRSGSHAIDEALRQATYLKKMATRKGTMFGPRLQKLYLAIIWIKLTKIQSEL